MPKVSSRANPGATTTARPLAKGAAAPGKAVQPRKAAAKAAAALGAKSGAATGARAVYPVNSDTALQDAIANRVRIVLSLCDQRADFRISHTVLALGLSPFLPASYAPDHTLMSRRTRGQRPWTPDLLVALCKFVMKEFGIAVDPGWLCFGELTTASPPEIPQDLVLRDQTTLDEGMERSELRMWQIFQRDYPERFQEE